MPDYPRNPKEQLKIMLRQVGALFTYLASMIYRGITGPLRGKDSDYVSYPALWLVAESGNIYGKLLCMWHTRYYRKQFWLDGPKVI
jgi:hypothetical protein